MATIAIALLLLGSFYMMPNFVRAGSSYKYLTVAYDPDPMMGDVVPQTFPLPGVHEITIDSIINVAAPHIVPVDECGIRYKFNHWIVWYEESNITEMAVTEEIMVTMDENVTVTVYYKLQYRLTLENYLTAKPWLGIKHNGELEIENGTAWQTVYSLSCTTVEVQENSCAEYAWMCGTVAVESFQHAAANSIDFQVGLIDEKVAKWYLSDYNEYGEPTPNFLQYNGLFLTVLWDGTDYQIYLEDWLHTMPVHTTKSPSFEFKMQIWMCGDPDGKARVKINDGTGWTGWSAWFDFDDDYLNGVTDEVDFSQAYVAKMLCESNSEPVCNTTYRGTADVFLWIATNQSWFDYCCDVYAGLTGLVRGPNGMMGVYTCPNQFAWLKGWPNVYCTKWYYGDPIHMEGPYCTDLRVSPPWAYVYMLYVKKGTPPPMTDPPSGAEGWYEECTYVNVTAPNPHPTWISKCARWRFDNMTLDGVPVDPGDLIFAPDTDGDGLSDNATLTVHMDKNHTVTVYYRRQSFAWVCDDISNKSGICDTGNWYDNCINYTFYAPPWVDIDSSHRYIFKRWTHSVLGLMGTTNTIELHVDSDWDCETLTAVYHMQYKLNLDSICNPCFPENVFLYPDSDTTGWYDAGSTVNLKALPNITLVQDCSMCFFTQWNFHPWTTTNNNFSFTMLQPWNATAEYELKWLMKKSASPDIIGGWPVEWWVKNCTSFKFKAPAAVGDFVFDHWEIDSTVYPDGQRTVWLHANACYTGIAFYANKTCFYLTPDRIDRNAHSEGYCTKFDVTVMAANFDADRIVNGESMAIYAMDFKICFDKDYLQIQHVTLHLDEFWEGLDYIIAKNEIDNVNGEYWLSATVYGDNDGFSGTKPVVTINFHVIKAPCWPEGHHWSKIKFCKLELYNDGDGICGHRIYPECTGQTYTWYHIFPPKMVLEIRDANDGDNHVIIHKNVPQSTFYVDVWLLYGIKVHDFRVCVCYDSTQIDVVDVIIGDYLKPPFYKYSWWKGTGWVCVQVIQEGPPQGAPLQNCSGILFTIKFKVVKSITYHICPGAGIPHQLHSKIEICSTTYISACGTNIYDINTVDCDYTYNPLIGDVDHDGKVTVLDLQAIIDHYCCSTCPQYDITGDGHVDIEDLIVAALAFGDEAPPPG